MEEQLDIFPNEESSSDEEKNHILYSAVLSIGNWRKKIADKQRKAFISLALNKTLFQPYDPKEHDCKKDESDPEFKIIGYLISKKRVFLLLDIKYDIIEDKINQFVNYLNTEIITYLNKINFKESVKNRDQKGVKMLYGDLFKAYPLYNNNIIRLLTGRQPLYETAGQSDYKYYSPYLARLTHKIHQYDYCSALDYEAAKNKKEDDEGKLNTDASRVIVSPKIDEEYWKTIRIANWDPCDDTFYPGFSIGYSVPVIEFKPM